MMEELKHDSTNPDSTTLAVVLPTKAHQQANEFAALIADPAAAKRVRRNTLAIYAVNEYMRWLDVPTDLAAGDSWNPLFFSAEDVADLVLPNLGRLECRPFAPEASDVDLPETVQQDRIGYVGVELATDLSEAYILGFIPSLNITNPATILKRSELLSREQLIDHLYRLEILPQLLSEEGIDIPEEIVTDVVAQLERVFLQENEVLWGIEGELVITAIAQQQDSLMMRNDLLVESFREANEMGVSPREEQIEKVLQKLAQLCQGDV